jgi:hypothetical protein
VFIIPVQAMGYVSVCIRKHLAGGERVTRIEDILVKRRNPGSAGELGADDRFVDEGFARLYRWRSPTSTAVTGHIQGTAATTSWLGFQESDGEAPAGIERHNADIVAYLPSSPRRWQAISWPFGSVLNVGNLSAQIVISAGHRDLKGHPLGGLIGLGTSPERMMRPLRSAFGSGTGEAEIRAWV